MKRVVMLVGVVLLLAGACGGGDDGGDDAPAATDGPPAVGVSATEGEALYDATCVACHGEKGVGVEGLGKPLVDNAFIAGTTDPELVTFIKVGRDASDPDNTTGIAMPPKGGNPALTEADLESIVAYLRTLN